MHRPFKSFVIRDWQPPDRDAAADLIGQVLNDYGLGWEPEGADIDVVQVETHYQEGEFWVVEQAGKIVGSAAYRPIERGEQAVEIRKMYLLTVLKVAVQMYESSGYLPETGVETTRCDKVYKMRIAS